MGHYWRLAEPGGSLLRGPGSLSLILVALLALLLAALLAAALARRTREPERSEVEREVYDNLDGQIRAMLLLAGGELTQDRISDNLGIPAADVGRELAEMEKRGEIRREWLSLDYTYRVYLSGSAADHLAPPDITAMDPQRPD